MTTPHDTELTALWRTSSRSTGGNECVEVAQTQASCLVRDSTQPQGTRLAVGPHAWAAFTRRLKDQIVVG
jgi:hypothetical protein